VVSFKTGRLDTLPADPLAEGGNSEARRGEATSVYVWESSSGMPFMEAGRDAVGSGTEVGSAGVLELE